MLDQEICVTFCIEEPNQSGPLIPARFGIVEISQLIIKKYRSRE